MTSRWSSRELPSAIWERCDVSPWSSPLPATAQAADMTAGSSLSLSLILRQSKSSSAIQGTDDNNTTNRATPRLLKSTGRLGMVLALRAPHLASCRRLCPRW